MRRHCIISSCLSLSHEWDSIADISYHRFPKDPEARAQWVKAILEGDEGNTNMLQENLTDDCCVCSRHFTDDMYQTLTSIRRLKKGAVPNIFKCEPKIPAISASTSKRTCVPEYESPPKFVFLEENDQSNKQKQIPVLTEKSCNLQQQIPSNSALTAQGMNTTECDTDTEVKFVILKEAEYRGLQNEQQHMRQQIAALSEENRNLKQQVKNAVKREKRAKERLSDVLNKLQEVTYISEDQQITLDNFAHLPLDLFTKGKYTEEQKRFAATLHLYSSKAYDFVRQHIPLPHPRSLRR